MAKAAVADATVAVAAVVTMNVTTVAAKAATAISKNSPPLPNGK